MYEIARWLGNLRRSRPRELLAATSAALVAGVVIACISCLALGTVIGVFLNSRDGSTNETTGLAPGATAAINLTPQSTTTPTPLPLEPTSTPQLEDLPSPGPTFEPVEQPLPEPTATAVVIGEPAQTPALTVTSDLPAIVEPSNSLVSTTTIEPLNVPAPESALAFTPTSQLTLSAVIFVENTGQFPAESRFQVRGALGGSVWLAPDAIWLTIVEPAANANPAWQELPATEPPSRRGTHIKLSFDGANAQPELVPFDPLDTHVSYLQGSDPNHWQTGVPVWGGVRYQNLYPGIDLELTSQEGAYTQRFVVQPGADLSVVRLRVEGAQGVALEVLPAPGTDPAGPAAGGKENVAGPVPATGLPESAEYYVRLSTDLGEFSLPLYNVHGADGSPLPLTAAETPSMEANNSIKFPFLPPIEEADPGKVRRAIPASGSETQVSPLLYTSQVGQGGSDMGYGIAVDEKGYAFVTGYTYVAASPFGPGTFDANNKGHNDAFLAKLKDDGSKMAYAVFMGGDGDDQGLAVAVDESGRAYITGITDSPDLPTTAGAFDAEFGGGQDLFVARIGPAGTGLDYATYLGGGNDDWGQDIAVDKAGSAYIAGSTQSTDMATTTGAWDTSGDGQDAFVVKVNALGTGLAYATYLGGSQADWGNAIAVDKAGSAHVVGTTQSSDFPSLNGFDTGYNGSEDAYLVRLNPSGTELDYGSFLGGSGADHGYDLALDIMGNVLVVGSTLSPDFPASARAIDSSHAGNRDAFVAKVHVNGGSLTYASFLGDSGDDVARAVAVDSEGYTYVAGSSESFRTPARAQALGNKHQGQNDAFVVRLDELGSALAYATFVGGAAEDHGWDIAIDSMGSTYLAGSSNSRDFTFERQTDPSQEPTDAKRQASRAWDSFVVKVAAGTPFLDLPVSYANFARSALGNMNDNSLGRVNSWFDHNYPNHRRNQKMVRWDGSLVKYNSDLPPLIGESWYDGHGGTDFRWEARNEPIYAAAPGTVIDAFATCRTGDQACGDYFGNRVWLDHGNGYASVYAHLDAVYVAKGTIVSDPVSQPLGTMGNTGRSQGLHLHLGLYFDRNGDGVWTREEIVDPYGWLGGGKDPWNDASRYVWKQPLADRQLAGDTSTRLSSPSESVTVTVPAAAFLSPPLLELWDLPSEAWKGESRSVLAPTLWRSAGQTLRLEATRLDGRSEANDTGAPLTSIDRSEQPISLNVQFSEADVARLDATQLTIRHWDGKAGVWQPLETTLDLERSVATAQTADLGHFGLYAPLLCSTDRHEPDDHYAAALALPADGVAVRRSLDIAEDKDWFRIQVRSNGLFVAQASQLGAGVETILSLHHADTLATLATSDSRKNGGASYLVWQAPQDGQYLLRVSRAGGSSSGCDATYTLRTRYIYPLEEVTVAGPKAGLVNQTYAFTATISPISATLPITYTWQARDVKGTEPVLSAGKGLTFAWTTTGTHQILVTATNEGGVITTAHEVAIHGSLVANFTASPVSGASPLKVTFANTSKEGYEESVWDFGDGKNSVAQSPNHTYKAPGVYTVSLTVGALGGSDTLTRTEYIVVTKTVQPGLGEHTVYLPMIVRNR